MIKKMVEIRHFKMSFGDKTVIKDLSFDCFRGEVFGFLGSNGSGKNYDVARTAWTIPADRGRFIYKQQAIFSGKSDSPRISS